ncbi:MAG: sulfite exporter TauE/SafE family protein [Nisaea sp.]
MPLETILLLFSIGLVGGVWNAMAGGATLFTFPALMAVGLPSLVANATNYLAMLPSNLSALPAYRQELREIGHRVWPLMACSGLGAICGSLLLTVSDPKLFDALIPFLILFATGLFAFGDLLRARAIRHFGDHASQTLARIALFAFSIYGGYFGAGLGIILLAMVQIMGFATFHMANSLKNLLAASFTILSIGVFGIGGLIAWPEAAAMMVGSTIGGYMGGRCAKYVNGRYLRIAVIAFGVLLSGVYFYRMGNA